MPSPASSAGYVFLMLSSVVLGIWVATACYSSYLDYGSEYKEAYEIWSQEDAYIKANCRSAAAKMANERTRRNCKDSERIWAVQPSDVALQKVLRSWSLCSMLDCEHASGHVADSFTKILLLCIGLFLLLSFFGCTGLFRTAHANYGQYWHLPTAASVPLSPYPPSIPYGAAPDYALSQQHWHQAQQQRGKAD